MPGWKSRGPKARGTFTRAIKYLFPCYWIARSCLALTRASCCRSRGCASISCLAELRLTIEMRVLVCVSTMDVQWMASVHGTYSVNTGHSQVTPGNYWTLSKTCELSFRSYQQKHVKICNVVIHYQQSGISKLIIVIINASLYCSAITFIKQE